MTKADIIEAVYARLRLSKKESTEVVDVVLEALKNSLERGQRVRISGFGHFYVREKKPRIGRDPNTGRELEISARRVLLFRPSQVLRNALNDVPGPVISGAAGGVDDEA